MALTTEEQNSSPYTDLHVKPYAERHVKVYADNCLTGDLICNWSTSNVAGCVGFAWVPVLGVVPLMRPSCAHLHYPDEVGFRAATFLARQVRQAMLGPPRVATTALPPATAGTAYRQTLAVTGGRAPYIWSLTGGRLPTGLALTPSGSVEGTPTQAEVRSFQVRVRDANWRPATRRLTLAVQSAVPAPADAWPQIGGNPAHDGFNPSVSAISRSSAPSLAERWATDISGPTLGGDASPVVADGRVYLQVSHSPTTDGAALLALDAATGATIWSQPLPSTPAGVAAAAVANGVVAVGDGQQLADGAVHGSVRAFDAATGDPLWTVPAGYSAPPLAADGATFYAASDYQLQALDAVSHQPRWTTDLPGFVSAPPAVGNGLVLTLIGTINSGQLVAVDQATGQQRWTTGLGPAADIEQPPVIAGGLVYVADWQDGTRPAALTAYELDTGNQRWTQDLDMSDFGQGVSTPAVAAGTVMVGDEDGNLYAFDAATGQLRYKHSDPHGLLAFAGGFAITGGVLVTSDADATVRVLDIQNGAELWRQDISETNAYGPPAVAAGRIYVATATRLHVYAIPGS